MSRLDPLSLRLFVLVVEEGTIAAAAQRAHLVPAAVSRRIGDLERALDVPLLTRTRRGVEPTEAGTTLLALAREALHAFDQIPARMPDVRGEGLRGLVRIAANTSSISQFLAARIKRFLTDHPGVRVVLEEMTSAGVVRAVVENSADVGIFVHGASEPSAVTVLPFERDRLAVVVPGHHRLRGGTSTRFEPLLDDDFVCLQPDSAVHRQLYRAAASLDRAIRVRVHVTNFDALCTMVEAGLGIGVLPNAVAQRLAPGLGLSVVELDEPWADREIALAVRDPAALSPAARRLVETIAPPA